MPGPYAAALALRSSVWTELLLFTSLTSLALDRMWNNWARHSNPGSLIVLWGVYCTSWYVMDIDIQSVRWDYFTLVHLSIIQSRIGWCFRNTPWSFACPCMPWLQGKMGRLGLEAVREKRGNLPWLDAIFCAWWTSCESQMTGTLRQPQVLQI